MMLQQRMRFLLGSSICMASMMLATATYGQYVQLVDLPTLSGDDGTALASGTIDGTTGYAVLSGGGLHRIVKIDDIGGANSVTTLVSTSDWNNTVDPGMLGAPSGISGVPFISGSSLLIADLTTDQVVSVDTTTGVATLLVDEATVGGSIGFAGLNRGTGNLLVYQSSADFLYETTGAVNGFNLILDDLQLTTVTGDDTPTGASAASDGVIYLGQGSSGAGENIYFYDPSDMSNGVLATESDIVGALGDVSMSPTAFNLLEDGVLYFGDLGDNDAFRSIDPSVGPSSISEVIREVQLVAGPAQSDFVSSFSLYGGNLAWVQTQTVNGQVPGFYAIPEPSSLAIGLGLAIGLVIYRRR